MKCRRGSSERLQGLFAQPAVSHFHLGADLLSSAPSGGLPRDYRAVRAALDNEAPTFLMVGTIEPRKGYAEVLEAFDQLWAAGHAMNLVVVGKAGWMVDDTLARFDRMSGSVRISSGSTRPAMSAWKIYINVPLFDRCQ